MVEPWKLTPCNFGLTQMHVISPPPPIRTMFTFGGSTHCTVICDKHVCLNIATDWNFHWTVTFSLYNNNYNYGDQYILLFTIYTIERDRRQLHVSGPQELSHIYEMCSGPWTIKPYPDKISRFDEWGQYLSIIENPSGKWHFSISGHNQLKCVVHLHIYIEWNHARVLYSDWEN